MDHHENVNDGTSGERRTESYTSKKSQSVVESDGMPKGPGNISNIFTGQNDVPGIFAPDVRRNNIDGPTASSEYEDSSTNLMGETHGNVTEMPAVITGGTVVGAQGKRLRNYSPSSSNSPSIQSDSVSCGTDSTSWDEAKSEKLMFGENGWYEGEDEHGNND